MLESDKRSPIVRMKARDVSLGALNLWVFAQKGKRNESGEQNVRECGSESIKERGN